VRIALFGGSFDPPHWGHVLAACWAQVAGQCDQVWILPVARHPYGKPISPWAQRWALCQEAFTPLGFARLRDDELANPAGYTFDLVERLEAAHPGTQWLLVGGTDTATDLPRWHRGPELAARVRVLAVPRGGAGAALPDIASSAIRAQLARGEPIDGLVPPQVASRIARELCYRPPG
jgi:nicotinate-nucleotide adenylyltransferase